MNEAELRAILGAITDGITVQDPTGKLLYANDAAARLIGFSSSEELLAEPLGAVMERFEMFDEGGAPLSAGDLPGRHALAGSQSERRVGFRVRGSDETRWSVVRAMPVFGSDGQVALAVNVFRDVTERRALEEERERVRRHLSFLNEATRTLDEGPLDADRRIERLAQVAVPTLADWCAVYRRTADGAIRLWAFAHRDPARSAAERAIYESHFIDPERPFGAPRVIRTGEPELLSEITDEMLRMAARDPEQLRLMRESTPRSGMTVPLRVRGQVIGAVSLASADRLFRPEDLVLARELAERAGLAVETAQLYEAAQQAVRQREEMMAVVSHDLRNPLSTISMATELLLRSASPELLDRSRRASNNIQRAVVRMERLIHDLLDLARIEGAGLTLDRNEHDLASLVAESLDLHLAIAAEKQLKLVNEAAGPAPASCDRERILQAFANLVDNAFKFSPMGGEVRLGARRDGREVVAWVSDSGPGVPLSERARIFEPYWQARRDRKGLGLGLAIVRGVVEAHGGRIWVEGEPGKGARFLFSLPTT